MKNKVFMRKTADEKRRHLSSALRYAAGGALDDGMIGSILPRIAIHRQYTILAFSDNLAFQEAVARTQADIAPLSIIHSRTGQGTAVAITMPQNPGNSAKSKRAIYILTPNLFHRKGAKQWARASKSG